MKKLATALLALILALGCTVSAFAVETEASAIGVHLPQQLERLETLKTTAVSQEINPAITVKNDNAFAYDLATSGFGSFNTAREG